MIFIKSKTVKEIGLNMSMKVNPFTRKFLITLTNFPLAKFKKEKLLAISSADSGIRNGSQWLKWLGSV
ncbi:hypothetical protein BA3_0025 [Thalassomonas phage BA3]|uniref:hypothetical protein n=1 Tax=Thalassomonas phage BA3 TaxID=469660 RepID=UPI00015D959E|nr:hypothetical protein BA3_0025 [Thalassomonas phage BA3]ABV74310.1 hypothetical protein BA3_0025 [Thalassomonas phage BA3]